MNAPVASVAPAPAPVAPVQKPAIGLVRIIGRCQGVRRAKSGNLWYHLIVTPAPDPYSSPSTLEVTATKRVATKDEDVDLTVRLGGYRRQYNSRDDETGEITKIVTADVRLSVVE